MEVKERVEKIKPYFGTLSISDGAICVVTRFPESWWLSDPQPLRDQFKCEMVCKDGCVFFMTELENGFDAVFDCVEYIIDTNNAILEKKALLEAKASELTELFVKEPLEKLKTLYFAFDETIKKPRPKKATKKEPVVVEKVVPQEEIVQDEPVVQEQPEEVSSLLSKAMELTEL